MRGWSQTQGLWSPVLEGAQRQGSREEETVVVYLERGDGWETHRLMEEEGQEEGIA